MNAHITWWLNPHLIEQWPKRFLLWLHTFSFLTEFHCSSHYAPFNIICHSYYAQSSRYTVLPHRGIIFVGRGFILEWWLIQVLMLSEVSSGCSGFYLQCLAPPHMETKLSKHILTEWILVSQARACHHEGTEWLCVTYFWRSDLRTQSSSKG